MPPTPPTSVFFFRENKVYLDDKGNKWKVVAYHPFPPSSPPLLLLKSIKETRNLPIPLPLPVPPTFAIGIIQSTVPPTAIILTPTPPSLTLYSDAELGRSPTPSPPLKTPSQSKQNL